MRTDGGRVLLRATCAIVRESALQGVTPAGSLDVKGERGGFGPRIALARRCAPGSTHVVSGQSDLRSVIN